MMRKHIILLTILSTILIGCGNINKRLGYESEDITDEDSVLCTLDEDLDTVVDVAYEEPYPSYDYDNTGRFNNGKISLSYPSSWEVVQQNAQVTDRTTVAVQVMQKSMNDFDFKPNINVIFSKDKHTERTSSLAKTSFNQVKDSGLPATLLEIKNCYIGGCKGSVVEYIIDIENYKMHVYQYILKKRDNTTITITTTLDHYNLNQQRKVAQSIIDSIIIY